MPPKTIEDVLREHADRLMALPGVVGVGIGKTKGQPCIIVLAGKIPASARVRIPETLGGYPVVIEKSGEFKALDES